MHGSRRAFLGTALGLAATTAGLTAGLGTTAHAADASAAAGRHGCRRRRIPPSGLGMHLYTMRTPLAQDFKGTLARLAETGYATVGVSGRHGHSAAAIRQMLDETRLKAVLEHVGHSTVTGSGLPQALEDIHTLGARWIVVPSLPGEMHSPAGFREAARQFNKAGLAAREAGLGPLLFHNHGSDHAVVEGENLYDILLTETDPELVGFELDVYWAAKGGADPRSLFVRHRHRFPALHVKDMAPDGDFADVGSGVLDFAAMFDTAKSGGVRQWLVEHDSPADPFATALNSYTYLSRLRY
ncbi:sugar phosphate isomerase/epimerase [Streptomyces sp. NBC_01619]|uniref:Sugar phosphate isomerase/epimerase n=1 Tax=Streptomyces pratisoli TaxID=3139917 RepID=A0ACC6QRT3_9ACTN|nr:MULTISPECIES: sugar phosphate isomerase/epimerase [unclassified Streptomyces]MCX4514177.1 sugar phosphate isomerase/epimerase [Streptomyces sp. NBC_01619]